MNLDETIRAIEVHKQRLCNQCPVKMDEPRCWDVLVNESYSHLVKLREQLGKPQEPNPLLTWEEIVTMRGKPIWVEYRSKLRKPHYALIAKVVDEHDPRRLIVYRTAYPTVKKIDKELFKVTYGRDWWAYRRER